MEIDQSALADFPRLLSFIQDSFQILPLDLRTCPAHFTFAVPRDDALASLPRSLHPQNGRISCGRGLTAEVALASCLGETAELLCSAWRNDIETIVAAPGEVEGSAILPSELLLSDPEQNAVLDTPIDWVEVQDLEQVETRLVPTGLVYLDHGDRWHCDSNGCAAASRQEQALIRATLELIERDATAIWWFGKHRRPTIPVEHFSDPALSALASWHSAQQRRHHLLDLTTDFGVPVYGAVSSNPNGTAIALGFAAHPDPRKTALSAFTEMMQIELSLATYRESPTNSSATDINRWLSMVNLETAPYLVPDGKSAPKPFLSESEIEGPELLEHLKTALQAQGVSLWWRDLSRPEVGIPVVRAIAPGLRHVKGGVAPGRLYDVPPSIGWSARSPNREDLNDEPLAV